MNLLTDNIRKIYFKYLFPSLFSGLVMSIYSLVDMIVVGQYEGADGTAALACIAPLWTFFCCLSVLFGNGGAVLFSTAKGKEQKNESNEAFTVSFILISIFAILVWIAILLFDEPLLRLCGADEKLLPLALRYMKWLKLGVPLWPLGYFLAMFIRNDGSPTLAGIATICGGVFNIGGDYYFTFTCDLGIEGAAIATVVAQLLAFCIQLLHFFAKKNTITFVVPSNFWKQAKAITSIGFSSFLTSLGMGFVVILFNNQITNHFGNFELAVYGVASNFFMLIQTFSYGIGNAAQPILAENLGAGNLNRVHQIKRISMQTAVFIGLIVTAFTLIFPGQLACLYMKADTDVMITAPSILRRYFICLLFVPLNVFISYYLQAVQRVKESVLISALRGFILGGFFVYLYPLAFGADSIWYVMLSAECITTLIALWRLKKSKRG